MFKYLVAIVLIAGLSSSLFAAPLGTEIEIGAKAGEIPVLGSSSIHCDYNGKVSVKRPFDVGNFAITPIVAGEWYGAEILNDTLMRNVSISLESAFSNVTVGVTRQWLYYEHSGDSEGYNYIYTSIKF